MDQSSLYQFCLASVTETFKQYVRESGEFLIVFSHFDDKSWQQKTLKVERELRKRRELIERRPLVNFYILISNASELRAKVDSIKGEPRASVIPFSFEELLACKNTKKLTDCMLNRFGEYYFLLLHLRQSANYQHLSLLAGKFDFSRYEIVESAPSFHLPALCRHLSAG